MKKMSLVLLALLADIGMAQASDMTVSIAHLSFDMDAATIKAGETITFTNNDDAMHNLQVVNAEGAVGDKGLQKPGQDIKAKFAKAGSYTVRCALHPKMKMKVKVE